MSNRWLVLVALSACRCASNPNPGNGDGAMAQPGWVTLGAEDFEATTIPPPAWVTDPVPDDGPFADGGSFFRSKSVTPPAAFRSTTPLGFLTIESYSRSKSTTGLAAVVPDPAGGMNRVLRISSPAHTDATVLRPTDALPDRYRISLRVGYADFGDGRGNNGYSGGETAEPWSSDDATAENGFYWLAILDALPRPHNNVWIHHHRKLCIDSDNNRDAWTAIWDGTSFKPSGEHPVMMFALDGAGTEEDLTGPPFIPYSNGAWQPSGTIRAVDAYKASTWYRVSITREGSRYTLSVDGDFRYGGQKTYTASIDSTSIFHAGAPEWFVLGDPHANYYEGAVYFDDVKLEVWR
jgi:hypothetical protein